MPALRSDQRKYYDETVDSCDRWRLDRHACDEWKRRRREERVRLRCPKPRGVIWPVPSGSERGLKCDDLPRLVAGTGAEHKACHLRPRVASNCVEWRPQNELPLPFQAQRTDSNGDEQRRAGRGGRQAQGKRGKRATDDKQRSTGLETRRSLERRRPRPPGQEPRRLGGLLKSARWPEHPILTHPYPHLAASDACSPMARTYSTPSTTPASLRASTTHSS
jgi:hypothetical protein